MQTKILRSLALRYFNEDLLIKIHSMMYFNDVDNNTKGEYLCNLLTKHNIPYEKLGQGTNRYGILIDGYVVKIALDFAGTIDNRREFVYSKILDGVVCRVHECMETGLIAVFEYYTIFSLDDYYEHQDDMRKILKRITGEFLIGDVGVTTKNYVNWGISPSGKIGMIDFAYIYSVSFRSFLCTCDEQGVLDFDDDFNILKCPICGKTYQFRDIRKRISREDELNEIGDLNDIGYKLHSDEEEVDITKEKSPQQFKKKKNKKEESDISECNDDPLYALKGQELLDYIDSLE